MKRSFENDCVEDALTMICLRRWVVVEEEEEEEGEKREVV